MVTWEDILDSGSQYSEQRLEYWMNEVFSSGQWWVLFITGVSLLTIWIIVLDKKRIMEIVAYGMMVAIIANFGDTVGLSFSLWGYPYTLMHTPEIMEIHNVMMPIFYMIIYQYFKT